MQEYTHLQNETNRANKRSEEKKNRASTNLNIHILGKLSSWSRSQLQEFRCALPAAEWVAQPSWGELHSRVRPTFKPAHRRGVRYVSVGCRRFVLFFFRALFVVAFLNVFYFFENLSSGICQTFPVRGSCFLQQFLTLNEADFIIKVTLNASINH